ncbi:MAG: hypothetical protein MJ234_06400, partial [bacterium]|nr:hypothetical protein [bacterium]
MLIGSSMNSLSSVQMAAPQVSVAAQEQVQAKSEQMPALASDSVSIEIPVETKKSSSSKRTASAHKAAETHTEAKTAETAERKGVAKPKKEGQSFKTAKAGDNYLLNDGMDASRDIVSVSSKEGAPTEPYTFKVTMKELKEGAQYGHLDTYLLLNLGIEGGKLNLPDEIPGSTANPWNLALCGYDEKNFSVLDENGSVDKSFLKNIKFDPSSSSVEFQLDKEILR